MEPQGGDYGTSTNTRTTNRSYADHDRAPVFARCVGASATQQKQDGHTCSTKADRDQGAAVLELRNLRQSARMGGKARAAPRKRRRIARPLARVWRRVRLQAAQLATQHDSTKDAGQRRVLAAKAVPGWGCVSQRRSVPAARCVPGLLSAGWVR